MSCTLVKQIKITKRITTMLLSLIILACFVFSCFAPSCFSKDSKGISTNVDLNELDKYISSLAKGYNFNGSILVTRKSETIFTKGFGMADKVKKIPNSPKTKFLIGSMTKAFTAVAIMQLQEKGLLNVKDYVSKYIPKLPNGYKITIHQILTHTSGLPRDIPDGIIFNKFPSTYDEALKVLCSKNFTLLFKPGTDWSYSNLGYELLGCIIEKVSKQTYSTYLRDNIFKPLKMNNSGFGYDKYRNKDLASGYDILGAPFDIKIYSGKSDGLFSGSVTLEEAYKSFDYFPGSAGGIYSTTGDLAIWDRALYTEKLLSKKSINEMFTPGLGDYGYGWWIRGIGSSKVIWHGGTIYGFQTEIMRLAGRGACVIVLSNSDDVDAVSDISVAISNYFDT